MEGGFCSSRPLTFASLAEPVPMHFHSSHPFLCVSLLAWNRLAQALDCQGERKACRFKSRLDYQLGENITTVGKIMSCYLDDKFASLGRGGGGRDEINNSKKLLALSPSLQAIQFKQFKEGLNGPMTLFDESRLCSNEFGN